MRALVGLLVVALALPALAAERGLLVPVMEAREYVSLLRVSVSGGQISAPILPSEPILLDWTSCAFRFRSFPTQFDGPTPAEPAVSGIGVVFEISEFGASEILDQSDRRVFIPMVRFETSSVSGHSANLAGMIAGVLGLFETNRGCVRFLIRPIGGYAESELRNPANPFASEPTIRTLVIYGEPWPVPPATSGGPPTDGRG